MRLLVNVAPWVVVSCLLGQAAERSSVDFPFVSRDGYLWVKVSVPGRSEGIDCLFDTGAAANVLNLKVAEDLRAPLVGSVKARGVRGEATGHWVELPGARLDGIDLHTRFLAVDLGKITDALEGKIDGLIGADFLRGHAVQIDFTRSRIRILDPDWPKPAGEVLPLRFSRNGISVRMRVNGCMASWFRLDTGCASALHWFTRAQTPPRGPGETVALVGSDTPCGTATVRLGALHLAGVPVNFQGERICPGESGLVGLGLLSRFSVVTIDTRTKHLILSGFRG